VVQSLFPPAFSYEGTPDSCSQYAFRRAQIFAYANPVEIAIARIYGCITVIHIHSSEIPLMGKSQMAPIPKYSRHVGCRDRLIMLDSSAIPLDGKCSIAPHALPDIVRMTQRTGGLTIATLGGQAEQANGIRRIAPHEGTALSVLNAVSER
jgi:hypothetical protein